MTDYFQDRKACVVPFMDVLHVFSQVSLRTAAKPLHAPSNVSSSLGELRSYGVGGNIPGGIRPPPTPLNAAAPMLR